MAGQATARTPAKTTAGLSHRQILYAVSGLLVGMFLSALDQTIVSTSLRTIVDELHGYSQQAWVITAYLITSTIVTPMYGRLSDLYGRKPCYLAAIALFAVGSLACAAATSLYQLAVFRAVQGIGAGGLMSLPFTILGDIVRPRERARYQGYFLAVFTGASVLGPVLGGFFANATSVFGITGWRWVFLANVPLAALGLFVVSRVLNVVHVRRDGVRVDWLGGAFLVVSTVPLLVVATQGQAWGWHSARSIVCYCVCPVGVAFFVLAEKLMGEDAFMPLRVFRDRRFTTGVIFSFVIGAVMMGGFSLLPQYFQVVRGADPTVGGYLSLPAVLGVTAGSLLSGRLISRTGRYRTHSLLATALSTLTLFVLHYISAGTDLPLLLAVTLLLGLGLGACGQPLTVVMQNVLPARDMGVSTAAVTFFRQIGSTLGVAAFLSVWFAGTPSAISAELAAASHHPPFQRALRDTSPTQPAGRRLVVAMRTGDRSTLDGVANDTSVLRSVPEVVARPFERAFADAMRPVFLSASGLSLLALVVLGSWKPVPLRAAAGMQEAARERSAASAAAPDDPDRSGG